MKRIFCVVIAILLFPFDVQGIGTSAKAAILINGATGETVYEYNADVRLPMASTTKIMTALLLCENGDLDREITVTAEMVRVEGSSMGLLPGDKVKLYDLLYGMLLASGNDAANVTAYVLGGTVDGFVKQMNDKAKELGLLNTHFETPSGLDGDSHYTTARDLALLAKYAMENEVFCEAAGTKTKTLEYGNPPYRRTVTNHNRLLKSYDGAVGVKTGFTKKSGRCLVSAAKRDGEYLIAVTLFDPNDWADHKALLDYGFEKQELAEIITKNNKYLIPVICGEKDAEIGIEPFTVSTMDSKEFTYKINLPEFLYAPIEKGEIVGNVEYYKGGIKVGEQKLTCREEIKVLPQKASFLNRLAEGFKSIFISVWES